MYGNTVEKTLQRKFTGKKKPKRGFPLKEFWDKINPIRILFVRNRELSDDFIFLIYLILFLIIIYHITVRILDKFRPLHDPSTIYSRRKVIRYFYLVTGICFLVPIFYTRISYLPTILAMTAAGIIISTKDITLNIAGWMMIHSNSGFQVGDRVEIQGVKGDVVNIGMMRFTLLELNPDQQSDQSTNRLIHIPNHFVILNRIHVSFHSLDYVWDEVKLYVACDSNWKKMEEICLKILENTFSEEEHQRLAEKNKKLSEHYLVRMGKTTPIVYTTIENGKLLLSLRYLTRVHEKRNNRSSISRKILEEFKKAKLIENLK